MWCTKTNRLRPWQLIFVSICISLCLPFLRVTSGTHFAGHFSKTDNMQNISNITFNRWLNIFDFGKDVFATGYRLEYLQRFLDVYVYGVFPSLFRIIRFCHSFAICCQFNPMDTIRTELVWCMNWITVIKIFRQMTSESEKEIKKNLELVEKHISYRYITIHNACLCGQSFWWDCRLQNEMRFW